MTSSKDVDLFYTIRHTRHQLIATQEQLEAALTVINHPLKDLIVALLKPPRLLQKAFHYPTCDRPNIDGNIVPAGSQN